MKKQVETKKTSHHRKIKYKNVFIFFFMVFIGVFCFYKIMNLKIKNIYIDGNTLLTDQQIIDIAGLHDYPVISDTNAKDIKNKLEENVYIKSATVKYRNLMREIDIDIVQNEPLLYYEYENIYLLADGSKVNDSYDLPTLINQTPDNILKELLTKLETLDESILMRISEIRYYPSDVDDELFYLTMTDGNYIYINFDTFDKLDTYIEILVKLEDKKGIIHLDSGNYLEILE